MSESNLGSRGDKYYDRSDDIKRKRRTRNDEDGRNFSCNCGKSYLSYPALYTHIKTKHQGKPEYTKLPFPRDEDTPDPKDEEEPESPEKQEEANNLEQLRKYLNKFFPAGKEKEEKRGRELLKEEQAYLKAIREYWQRRKKEEEAHENEAYSTPIDYVLGKFLIDVEGDLTKATFRFLTDFVLNFRSSLNELKGEDYSKANSAAHLPALMNDLFIEKFQKMEEGHIYLRHPTIICKTLYHFSRWLFQERFTNLSLKFNTVS